MNKKSLNVKKQPDLEVQDFTIYFADGTEELYTQSETEQYLWIVGHSGELAVLRKLLHAMFTNTVIKEDRVVVHNARTWDSVKVHTDPISDD